MEQNFKAEHDNKAEYDNKAEHNNFKYATFAGGCFWCMVPPFDGIEGVITTEAGYTGGQVQYPTYREVCTGRTGHYEAIRVTYDPTLVSYDRLLDIFWHQIEPTDPGGQFADRGTQYGTAIFYHDEEQKKLAEQSKSELDKSTRFDKPIVTRILTANTFFPAEEYHQNYHIKNPVQYNRYKEGSGRAHFLRKKWEETDNPEHNQELELRKRLTPLQYKVTRESATEPPFENEYWANKEPGIYVDIVTGEPLFTSLDKYNSGCGWPSFTKPINDGLISERSDTSHNKIRTEVRSKKGDSHLGHKFDDGPAPTGVRYCINSASLRFIPFDKLESEGYGDLSSLFPESLKNKRNECKE